MTDGAIIWGKWHLICRIILLICASKIWCLGLVGGKVTQGIKVVQLRKLKDSKVLRKAETDFYKDYIQQTSIKRKDLGNIDFTQAGLETVSKQPEAGRNFSTLKTDVKYAKYIRVELPAHPRNDDIIKYHILEKDNQEFLIGETSDGKKYYMSKIKNGSEVQPSGVDSEPFTNIIPDINKNVKPIGLSELRKNIKNNTFDKKNLQVTHNASRKGIFTQVLQNEDNGVILAEREFNDVIKDMAKKTTKYRSEQAQTEVENKIQDIINRSPYAESEEFTTPFGDKYAKALDDTMQYNNAEFKQGNYFGGEDINPPTGLTDTAKTRLNQTMGSKKTLPKELQEAFNENPSEYDVLHNTDLQNMARNEIEKNSGARLARLQVWQDVKK